MIKIKGVITASATPFERDLVIDQKAFDSHLHSLLEAGSHYVSPFGTTGESASIPVEMRITALRAMIKAGVAPDRIIPGTGACAIEDAVKLTRDACELGVAALLISPPFFYPQPCEEGLVTYFSPLIEAAKQSGIPVLLYNIPQMTGVKILPSLLERLIELHGNAVGGVKDSSGDWQQTVALLKFAHQISILPGSEGLLEKSMPLVASGCISGSMNVTARFARQGYDALTECDSVGQSSVTTMNEARRFFERHGLMQSVKAILNSRTGNENWGRFRPPLRSLDKQTTMTIVSGFERLTQTL